MTAIRNGAEYIASLQDRREVFYDGAAVGDATRHPAFRHSIASVGRLYDFQAAPENAALMTFPLGNGERRANRIWQLPASYEEMVTRRRAMEAWTELHAGFLGRAPDHLASAISGMYMGLEQFEAYDKKRAGALADYYRHARDNSLFLTSAIINPQADRSAGAGAQKDPYLTAGIVDRDHEGVTLRGAKMLATASVLANDVLVAAIQPLGPGEDRYGITAAVPMGSKGLKVLSRKSYEAAAPTVFDNPLASRFDENDAVLYFEDVKVPWERVFVAGDAAMSQKQFFATPAHAFMSYQSMIRLAVKLRFLLGIARRTAEMNGILGFPQVRETLGRLAAEAASVEGMMYGMEANGHRVGPYYLPDGHLVYAAQVLTQALYPRFVEALRELAGGGMVMLPASVRDFANREIAALVDKTQQSPAAGARDKVKFNKLAWDAVGSEFGSRHTQYEMFYAGASFMVKGNSFRTYDWERATSLVDRMMAGYELETKPAAEAAWVVRKDAAAPAPAPAASAAAPREKAR